MGSKERILEYFETRLADAKDRTAQFKREVLRDPVRAILEAEDFLYDANIVKKTPSFIDKIKGMDKCTPQAVSLFLTNELCRDVVRTQTPTQRAHVLFLTDAVRFVNGLLED